MTSDEMKALPPYGQSIVMEVWKLLEEMKNLRQEVTKLRRAIADEIE